MGFRRPQMYSLLCRFQLRLEGLPARKLSRWASSVHRRLFKHDLFTGLYNRSVLECEEVALEAGKTGRCSSSTSTGSRGSTTRLDTSKVMTVFAVSPTL